MANNHIEINQGTRLGYELRTVLDSLVTDRARLEQLKATMDQMIADSDYSAVESRFGLPTGKGSATYNLVAGASSELAADSSLTQLLDWCEAVVSA